MESHKGPIPSSAMFHYDWRTEAKDKISLENSTLITIREAGDLIGLLRIVSDKAYDYYITDVMVAPRHQKQGIGKLLMETAVAYCKQGGFIKIFLSTPPNNEEYYKKLGFNKAMCKHLEIKPAEQTRYIDED
jgi:ribosomal protein S18 acetylase RimI-like enzyme